MLILNFSGIAVSRSFFTCRMTLERMGLRVIVTSPSTKTFFDSSEVAKSGTESRSNGFFRSVHSF